MVKASFIRSHSEPAPFFLAQYHLPNTQHEVTANFCIGLGALVLPKKLSPLKREGRSLLAL